MLKRLITGVVLVLVIAGFFFLRNIHTAFFQILIMLLSALGSYEVARALGQRIAPAQKWVAVFTSAVTAPISYFLGLEGALLCLVFSAVLQLALAVICYERVTPEGLGGGILAAFYPSALLIPMTLANQLVAYSTEALLVIFLVPSCADTFAFFVGSLLKGPKLCPKISPKKTISGAIGGVLGGMIGGALIYLIYGLAFKNDVSSIWLLILAGGVGAVLTALGDLIESVIKRKVGIKDMGNILPGHGGIMDRIDGISFACPFVYLCFRLFLMI